jgi:hypothetical protein
MIANAVAYCPTVMPRISLFIHSAIVLSLGTSQLNQCLKLTDEIIKSKTADVTKKGAGLPSDSDQLWYNRQDIITCAYVTGRTKE